MTDELLKGIAFQVANMAKNDLRYRGELNGILAVYFHGSGVHRLRKVEKLAEEKAGKGWLDSGHAKDIVFGLMAAVTTHIAPEAIIVATAINDYESTPAFLALPEEEKDRIFENGRPRDFPGYFQAHDALMATSQTAERVCLYRQTLKGSLLVGEPNVQFFPQSEFTGRLKFYGGEPPPEVTNALKELLRERTQ